MIRILIADDHEIMRRGLTIMMAVEPDLEIVGTASDGVEAVALALRHRPDLVLMDVRMPSMDGLEATRRIIALAPTTRVLVLTGYPEQSLLRMALEAGASGAVVKTSSAPALLRDIRGLCPG